MNRKLRTIERWFDGATADEAEAQTLVAGKPEYAAHLEALKLLRTGARSLAQQEVIEPAQFPAFMAGIRERLEPAPRHHRGVWALASAVAASLIAAIAIYMMAAPPPENISAEVEQVGTTIEGAEVGYYNTDNGTMTVWVDIPEGDLP
ncbi:MAG TPA: hypothetical protein PLD73_10550 [Candidatus Hydrogenedentes bacterium]|mgnify:CR=1 FL=1|jgi:hypothetical protein|nr:hypothetical protein [Candidatus Hydrogenedentota bacterium]HPK00792.1 hypothetical protein [Candidatus Hydrogenedentota bacterium]